MTIARPRELELQQAAVQLFRERGFHATSMQDLAETLGMHRGRPVPLHIAETLADLLVDGLRAPGAVTPTSHRTNKEPDR